MKAVREMNKEIFRNNLLMAIREITNIDEEKIKLRIVPVFEQQKPHTAVDDSMRLVALSNKNIGNRFLSVEETVNLVACQSPLVPVWINVSFECVEGNEIVLKFETSLRFRKPSLLKNAETGHPPFKAII